MTSEVERSEGRAYLAPFLCLQMLIVLWALWRSRKEAVWSQYDWEINYSAGFIRRGLYGEVLRRFHLIPHASLIFALTIFASYTLIFCGVLILGNRARWSTPLALLVYSPATVGFTLLSPNRIGCKEVLFNALITVAAIAPLQNRLYSPLLAIAVGLLVLTHEVSTFYVPYLFAVLWLRTQRDWRKALTLFIGPALLALAAFSLASTHKGTAAQADMICRSVGGTSLDSVPCDGAIRYLTNTSQQAHEATKRFARYFHFQVEIPYIICLALLPVVPLFRSLFSQDPVFARRVLAFLVLAWVVSLPLFWFATDWDRWIYVHMFSTMILCLLFFSEVKIERQAT